MFKYILILLFGCISISTLSQTPELDSLKQILSSSVKNQDTSKVNLLNELSYQYNGIDYREALRLAEEAYALSVNLNFNKGIAIAKNRKASCYWIFGDNELAIECALSAASMAEAGHFKAVQAEAYRLLGVTYMDRKEMDKATDYINKAEHMALAINDTKLLMRVYNGAGLIQSFNKRPDTALVLLHKSLQIAEKYNYRFFLPVIFGNIGFAHNLTRTPDGYKLANESFQKSLILSRKEKNRYAEVTALNHMGNLYVNKKNYSEAQKVLSESLKLADQIGYRVNKLGIYMSFMSLKMEQGDFGGAHEYMRNYYALKDTILNEKKTRKIVEMELRHETEKREQTIKLLEQEKRIQTLWRNVFIVGIILSIGAGIVIYRLQQLRTRKANELLETQKKLNAKLKETDNLKSRFFANISHEFRTPLSLISAPIEEKLKSPRLSSSDKEVFSMVKRNTNRLLDLVNQLLDLSKLEAGKMELQFKSGNISEFLRLLVTSFDSLAEHKKITFYKNINITRLNAWYDSDKLEKIIINVLFNAFKFTPSGGTVDLVISSSDQSNLIIIISDTGRGITEDELPYVFTPFYQSKNAHDDGHPGTGLGLSLVSELVKLYKGSINLTSRLNEGTSITISIPIHWNETESVTNQSEFPSQFSSNEISYYENDEELTTVYENQVSTDSILIVEDNPDLRNFIARIFKNRFTVLMAEDGEQAVSMALEHVPDLIISDVMMPKMGGLELTEQIKLDERTSHIPVILLTAKVDDESRMQGFKTGADDYLAKPFSAEELKVRVNSLIELRRKLMIKFRDGLVAYKDSSPKQNTELSLDEKFIARAKEVVEKNLTDTSFGVEKFAEEMNLSRAQLFRKLKVLVDTSPTDFISDIRLLRAAELIRAKTDTISQISYKVGFNEQSYFAKRFRKKFGVSPSEYINS